jgi:hypothetical protein
MHNGLKPSRRSFKGVGWNRALPSAFGFGNGWQGDKVNDYFEIMNFRGFAFPTSGTVEIWYNQPATVSGNNELFSAWGPNYNEFFNCRLTSTLTYHIGLGTNTSTAHASPGRVCYQFTWTPTTSRLMLNGVVRNEKTLAAWTPQEIYNFYLGRTAASSANYTNIQLDEFRLYTKPLTLDECVANYNAGLGENPQDTVNLLCWLQFEQFEMLDFSVLQNGSDMRLGVRDMSGRGNHAQQFNMDTNPASGGYVLKPF